jgi:hypothetical protein
MPGSVKICWWRKMEIRSERSCGKGITLHKVKEGRYMLHTIKRRKANWIGHILHRNCPLKRAIECKKGNNGQTKKKA